MSGITAALQGWWHATRQHTRLDEIKKAEPQEPTRKTRDGVPDERAWFYVSHHGGCLLNVNGPCTMEEAAVKYAKDVQWHYDLDEKRKTLEPIDEGKKKMRAWWAGYTRPRGAIVNANLEPPMNLEQAVKDDDCPSWLPDFCQDTFMNLFSYDHGLNEQSRVERALVSGFRRQNPGSRHYKVDDLCYVDREWEKAASG
jgi:hypothetical protein